MAAALTQPTSSLAAIPSSEFLPSRSALLPRATFPSVSSSSRRQGIAVCASLKEDEGKKRTTTPQQNKETLSTRRELLLQSSSVALLASVFSFSGTRPNFLGVKRIPPSLALCPSTPNCISTSEELNDPGHFVPPWTYNPEDGRGRKNPATQEQAMEELLSVVKSTKPDGFEPTIIEQRPDYLYIEYASPLFGFVDDVEFWFPPGPGSRVEYRSASRLGESDLDANRKRIKELRVALQKYGWASVGY